MSNTNGPDEQDLTVLAAATKIANESLTVKVTVRPKEGADDEASIVERKMSAQRVEADIPTAMQQVE